MFVCGPRQAKCHNVPTLTLCCCGTGLPFNSQRGRYIGGYFGFAMAFTSFTLLRSTINLFFALGQRLTLKYIADTTVLQPQVPVTMVETS